MAIDTAKVKQDYFSFDGSIDKKQYLISFLILIGISVVAQIIFGMLGSVGGILSLIVSIIIAVAGFSIAIRRFHDLGQSGWMSLLLLVPIINLIVIVYLCVADSKSII